MDHVSQMIGTMELVSKVTCTQKIGTMELVTQVTLCTNGTCRYHGTMELVHK